jgi:hypothetical protein
VVGLFTDPRRSRWGAWGYTKEEARANIQVVLKMTIESMIRHGETIPEDPDLDSEGEAPQIAITI